ncbi:ABC-type dipeptide/oligopeptide/nickel transport system permease subunit [Thermosipho japonicus]|uniref:ABC-type dipeptide/oligopeptide/nickel transport system permease subunit n=1 Tax=Thermosipho japonicus TaxID=90323 RepID=A0A841GRE0_9BACT|nr:ABC transporter permease [Thermosipho japonicus]MBB6062058.1 ABC-type dipeptide/oligopeptide/nickel transport system permease subunit [Thermosipho japonicus]
MANESITKIKIKLFLKNFKKNWELFKENKMGVFGLSIIIIFGLFAISYPIAWQFVDHSIYNPVTGTDPRIHDISYISKYMSPQNVIKGIEIPPSIIFTYSFLDQGEEFKKQIEQKIDQAQRKFVNLDYAQAFRHVLDSIVDNYFPMKERIRFQTQVNQLAEHDLITIKPIAQVIEIGDRKKFSLTSFKKLLEKLDIETLASALSPYKGEKEISTISLWIKITAGKDKRELFKKLLYKEYSNEEIKEAQNKIYKAISNLAREKIIEVQVSVSNQSDLESTIEFEKIPIVDLAKSTVFNTLVDILTLSKINNNYDETIKMFKNTKYENLLDFAISKIPDLSVTENKESNKNRITKYFEELSKEFSKLGLEFNLKEPAKLLDNISGINLAIITFDLSPSIKAKLEDNLSDYPQILESFRKKQENLFKIVANSRTYMLSVVSKITNIPLNMINIPKIYLSLDFTKLIPALDDPMINLLALATYNTKHFDLIVENLESAGDANYRRIDIVEKLKNHSPVTNHIKLLTNSEDKIISKTILSQIIKEYTNNLSENSRKYWEEKYSDILTSNNDFKEALNYLNQPLNLSEKEAKELVVSIYNDLALASKLGIQHPLPPNRWHILGTDPGGRDIFMQLWRSTPSEFMLGFLAAIITVTIGTIIGTTAAYYGGFIDTFFMRLADLMLLFPGIAFLIVLSGFFKLNLFWLALILGLLGGFGGITLVIKAQALTIKVKPYIEAAKVAGASNRYIIFNHIIPNVMPLSFLYMMFNVTGAVFSEASLSFFGLLRIRISWGIMINTAWTSGYLSSGNIGSYWWLWVPAGLIITIFCSGFYFLGRGLEEIVNPRLRKR